VTTNGNCDDSANIAACNYDNGECCKTIVLQGDCTDCVCHLTNLTHIWGSTKPIIEKKNLMAMDVIFGKTTTVPTTIL
jgi:hypothetical protein